MAYLTLRRNRDSLHGGCVSFVLQAIAGPSQPISPDTTGVLPMTRGSPESHHYPLLVEHMVYRGQVSAQVDIETEFPQYCTQCKSLAA